MLQACLFILAITIIRCYRCCKLAQHATNFLGYTSFNNPSFSCHDILDRGPNIKSNSELNFTFQQRSLTPPRWVSHKCTFKGCSEGFAVVDGNEKVNRTVCAAPRSKVRLPSQHFCMTSLCCRSPLTGGKHVKASKFCALHIGLENDGTSSSQGTSFSSTALAEAPNPHTLNPILLKDKVGEVPENDDATKSQRKRCDKVLRENCRCTCTCTSMWSHCEHV